ncbi:MAG: hypothetical protein LBE03_00590 [Candidatus Nomurabacteria bacterium]|jgi:cytochrome c biogenesis protein CcdA|nr:hypothetical protein [Candidatus Nomurabacteria bacterium]
MDKALKKHQIEASRALAELSDKDLEKYAKYHENVVKNFQHERAIHLAVTLFFAGILLLFFSVTILFHIFVPVKDDTSLFISISLSTIVVILLVTTIFYVRHYYQLENGTQQLYGISKEIYTRLK